MPDVFGKLCRIKVDKNSEGDRFRISRNTYSNREIDSTTETKRELVVKIFVRNKKGHAYYGYIPIRSLSTHLANLSTCTSSEIVSDDEIKAFTSNSCKIVSIQIGDKLFPTRGIYVMFTIVTKDNSSFEIAVN